MQKRRYLFLFILAGFLVAPQLGFPQFEDDSTKLVRLWQKLTRINTDLEATVEHHEKLARDSRDSGSPIDLVQNLIQAYVISRVQLYLEGVQWQADSASIFLLGCEYTKDKERENWQELTKNHIQGSIEVIEIDRIGILRAWPNITNKAALISIDKAKDTINTILNLLRKAENEISQSQ